MTFTNHPNLSDDINSKLAKMDIDGGVWLTMPEPSAKAAWQEATEKGNVLPVGKTLLVKTRNTLYKIEKREEGKFWLSGHPAFCPQPIQVSIHGSTFGGSMLRIGYVGRGMNLEWSKMPWDGDFHTTPIEEITEQ